MSQGFLFKIKGKGWTLYLIYLDHYYMPNEYLSESFKKSVFVNLELLANNNVFLKNSITESGRGEFFTIWTPYVPTCALLEAV